MTTPDWETLEDEEVQVPSQEESSYELLDDSVMTAPGEDTSGALRDTLQLADFAGPQIGVRGSAFLGEALSAIGKTPGTRKLLQSIGAVTGGFMGEGVEQLAPRLGGEEVAPIDALSSAAFGQLASRVPKPKGSGILNTSPMMSDIEALARPEVKAAMGLGKYMDPNIGDANPKWLSSNTRAAITGGAAQAVDKIQGYGSALGVGAHENAFSTSLLKEWTEKAGPVIESRIFKDAQSISQLGDMARVAASRAWEDGTSLLAKHSDELSLEPKDVLPLFADAADKIKELQVSSFTSPLAEARGGAILQALNDMQAIAEKNGGKLDPISASTMVKDLNKYRRDVLREFDKASQAGIAQGQSALKDVEATEALASVSSAINMAINDKVARSKSIPLEEKQVLSNFRDEYGGFSAVEAATNNFERKTASGRADKDAGKLVGAAGKREAEIPTTKTNMFKSTLDAMIGEGDIPVSPQTDAFVRAQTRNDRGMAALRDVDTIVSSPEINLPAQSASPRQLRGQLAGREAAMTGAGIAAPFAADYVRADNAQAEMSTPLDSYLSPDPFANGLPRDSSKWDDNAIARAIVDSSTSPKGPIVQQMVVKFKEAIRSEDQSKSERILADIAKISPELFEPGKGINGRLFHKDDQKEYLDRLHKAYRDGTISADFMYKQEQAFADPTNSLILPLEVPQASWRANKPRDLLKGSKSPRGMLGGAYAQIGPAQQKGAAPGGDYGQFDIGPGMSPRVGQRY